MIKSNFKTTIRIEYIKLEKNKIELNEEEIQNIVDKQVPSQRHLKLIFYYLYENNWVHAQSML